MFVTTQETPGCAPVATVADPEEFSDRAVWVGWNRSMVDLDSWLKACGYVRTSFEPVHETDTTKTYELHSY